MKDYISDQDQEQTVQKENCDLPQQKKNKADITSDGAGSRWDKKYTAAKKGCLQAGN